MSDDEFVVITKKHLDEMEGILKRAGGWIDRGQAATVLTTISVVEGVFEEVLKSCMVMLSKNMESRLFQGYGPLSTMAAKVDIAFALGLMSARDHADMQVIRKIRNEFAHSRAVTGFEEEIVAIVARLGKPKKPVDWAYDWYFARMQEIGYAVIDAAVRPTGKRKRKSA
jgi:hypothetical protein